MRHWLRRLVVAKEIPDRKTTRKDSSVVDADPNDDVLEWIALAARQHQAIGATGAQSAMPDDVADQMLARDLRDAGETGALAGMTGNLDGTHAASKRASQLLERLRVAARRGTKRSGPAR